MKSLQELPAGTVIPSSSFPASGPVPCLANSATCAVALALPGVPQPWGGAAAAPTAGTGELEPGLPARGKWEQSSALREELFSGHCRKQDGCNRAGGAVAAG